MTDITPTALQLVILDKLDHLTNTVKELQHQQNKRGRSQREIETEEMESVVVSAGRHTLEEAETIFKAFKACGSDGFKIKLEGHARIFYDDLWYCYVENSN